MINPFEAHAQIADAYNPPASRAVSTQLTLVTEKTEAQETLPSPLSHI